jgi:hypothetical protein
MDYHNAERRRLTRDGRFGYYAICRCGWRGPVRTSSQLADEDAAAHDIANNPIAPEDR